MAENLRVITNFEVKTICADSSVTFPNDMEIAPEAVAGKWKEITTFGRLVTL